MKKNSMIGVDLGKRIAEQVCGLRLSSGCPDGGLPFATRLPAIPA